MLVPHHRLRKGSWNFLILFLASVVTVQGADEPLVIEADQARQHVGKLVVVTFEVQAAKYSEKRKTVYLDSTTNFRDEKNLGIPISAAGIQDLLAKRGIQAPADYFRSKRIKVQGTVTLIDDRPYVPVERAEQIDLAPQ